MAEIGDLVPIDDNNTGRWPEGMAPSAVNDAGRADEGIMSRWHRDSNGSLTSAGTSSAYTLTTNQTLSAYYDGLEICFVAHVACTDNPTLQLGALTAAEIKTADNDKVSAGDIPLGSVVNVISQDNATTPTWRLMNSPDGSQTQKKVITTQGDIIRGNSSGEADRLALGASGQVLTSDGTDAIWQNAPQPPKYIEGLELSNNTTDAAHDMDITAGSATSDDGAVTITLSSAFTKRIDAAFAEGTNQGGLDTGTVAANTVYDMYVIAKDDGTADVLFTTKGSGPTLPTGFTKQRFIGRIPTDSSSNIVSDQICQQRVDGQYYKAELDTSVIGTKTVRAMCDNPLRIAVVCSGVSGTSSSYYVYVRLGGDSSVENTGYVGRANNFAAAFSPTDSWALNRSGATITINGNAQIESSGSDGRTFAMNAMFADGTSNNIAAGSKTLSQDCSQMEIGISAGDFDAGSIRVTAFAEGAYNA